MDSSVVTTDASYYSDLIKIGIPALTGLLAGLIAGLIPYYLEKNKLIESTKREEREFKRTQIVELLSCFSVFSGALFRYLYMCKSKNRSKGKEFEKLFLEATNEVLLKEVELKKARAISGLLGYPDISKKIDKYDDVASKTINAYRNILREGTLPEENLPELKELKLREKEIFLSLNKLASSITN